MGNGICRPGGVKNESPKSNCANTIYQTSIRAWSIVTQHYILPYPAPIVAHVLAIPLQLPYSVGKLPVMGCNGLITYQPAKLCGIVTGCEPMAYTCCISICYAVWWGITDY